MYKGDKAISQFWHYCSFRVCFGLHHSFYQICKSLTMTPQCWVMHRGLLPEMPVEVLFTVVIVKSLVNVSFLIKANSDETISYLHRHW